MDFDAALVGRVNVDCAGHRIGGRMEDALVVVDSCGMERARELGS